MDLDHRSTVAARRALVPLVSGSLLLAAPAIARAHERDFTLSRDWHLPYKGENEIEARSFWQTKHNDFVQQFEYEYGVTDHFAIEPGVEFKKPNGEEFEIEAAEVELRMNFLEFDYDKLLPAMNLEYERRIKSGEDDDADAEEESDNKLELKTILSLYTRDGQDFTVNANVGRGFGGEGEHFWEGEITAGYSRQLDFIPGLAVSKEQPIEVGVEFIQEIFHEHRTGLGPLVTWRASQHFHVLATYVFALRERSEESDELRFILEWEI
jgi:hypothetical protein